MRLKVIWAMIALCGVLATALLVKMTLMAFEPKSGSATPSPSSQPACDFPVGDMALSCIDYGRPTCVICISGFSINRCYQFDPKECGRAP